MRSLIERSALLATICIAAAAFPVVAHAAPQAQSLAQLAADGELEAGKKLFMLLREAGGYTLEPTKVKIVGVSDRALWVEADGADGRSVLEISEDRIARLAKIDSVLNGLIIGAATGASTALVITFTGCWGGGENGFCAGLVAAGAGIGGGIGIAFDALLQDEGTVIYRSSAPASALTFSSAPILTGDRKGVAFHVRW